MKNVLRQIPGCCVVLWLALCPTGVWAQTKPKFHVLAMAEPGGHHIAYSRAARPWLDSLAAKEHFSIDYIDKTDAINEAFLSKYQLVIQLDYVPYAWKPEAVAAFEKYIDEGKGGWIEPWNRAETSEVDEIRNQGDRQPDQQRDRLLAIDG